MPANNASSASGSSGGAQNASTFRLTTGETVTQDELIRRVTERVYQLWRDDLEIARSRGSETSLRVGRFPRGWRG